MPVCLSCRGQRKIQGIGFMGEVECKTCKGTGIAPVPAEIKPVEHAVEPNVSPCEIMDVTLGTHKSGQSSFLTTELKTDSVHTGEFVNIIDKSNAYEIKISEEKSEEILIEAESMQSEDVKSDVNHSEVQKRKYRKSPKL